MILTLISKGNFKDAAMILQEQHINPLIIKIKGDYGRRRALLEKYCIKNGFAKTGEYLNDKRVGSMRINKSTVHELREQANFNLIQHFRYQDPTGKTDGCGCMYCKMLHIIKMEKEKLVKVDIQLFKSMGASRKHEDFMTPNGGWEPLTLQGMRLYRIRYPKMLHSNIKHYLRQMDEIRQRIRQYESILFNLKRELQIPNMLKYDRQEEKKQSA